MPFSGVLPFVIFAGDEFVDLVKVQTGALLLKPLATVAWIGITGYGVATVVGKQLES
jgi:hypothetical protein